VHGGKHKLLQYTTLYMLNTSVSQTWTTSFAMVMRVQLPMYSRVIITPA